MMLVERALVVHEFVERLRDRWVWVISATFALLAAAITLYGSGREDAGAALVAPSIVTLATLFVPLVALVLGHDAICGERERNTLGMLLALPVGPWGVVLAKFVGRLLALLLAVGLGLGAAWVWVGPAGRARIAVLVGPTALLGAAFLSLGMLWSVVARRPTTAVSLVVISWFSLVFLYDLALLGLMVVTAGTVSNDTLAALVLANPAGLYRVQLLSRLGTESAALGDLGIDAAGLTSTFALIWALWIVLPLILATLLFLQQRVRK